MGKNITQHKAIDIKQIHYNHHSDIQDDPTTAAAPPSDRGGTPPTLHDHTPLNALATLR
jgi:hypothetical protein